MKASKNDYQLHSRKADGIWYVSLENVQLKKNL